MENNEKEAEYFSSRKEAWEWLLENGYKVSIGKFYQDIKRNGFPAITEDKKVSKYQVAVYGKSLVEENKVDISALERSESMHRKDMAEAEIAEIKARKMRREQDKLWLHSDDAWSVVAALVTALRDALRRAAHDGREELVEAAGGELLRAPELYEKLEEVVINRAFNEVVGVRLNIEWEVEDE